MADKFYYSLLTEELSGEVAKVIEHVYSRSYKELALPSAQQAWREHECRDNVVALAFSGDKVAGMISLKRSCDSIRVYELGMLSVLQEFRQSNLANELVNFAKRAFATLVDYDAIYMENVSTHYYSQRKAAQNGASDCALAVSAMPGLDGTERLSFINAFLENPLSENKHVYIPKKYANSLLFYYQGLKKRTIMPYTDRKMAMKRESETCVRELTTLGLLKQSFCIIGENFEDEIKKMLTYAKMQGIKTIQVYLPLSSSQISFAVDCLAKEGFFIGGILPFWFGADGLLLQKCFSYDLSSIKVYSSKARVLLQLLEKDIKGKL